MRRRVWRTVLGLVACALVIFVLPAFADSQARIVRLSYLDGSVELDRNTGEGFQKAIVNMPISQGAKLWTHEDGEVEIEFEDGSTVRLAPGTRVSFDELSLRSDGGKVSLVNVEDGTAYFNLRHEDKDVFKVAFAGNAMTLDKSAHFRAEVRNGQVSVAVFKGELALGSSEGEKKVKKNETVTFSLNNPAQYELAKGVDEGQFDWWDKERDKYQAENSLKKNSTYASSALGGPSYGWSDLSYYGNMFYVPGYGNMWRPYNVAYGWDPFSVGYWTYYPWGYTWVSPYPWGWTPYRYGSWQFVPGYGWAWQPSPGGYSNWYPRPRYTNPPSTFRAPVPPAAVPTRVDPTRAVIPVGNPNQVSMPRWTPRTLPNRQNPIVTRGGAPLPGGKADTKGSQQVDRKTVGGGTAPGSHAKTAPGAPPKMDRGAPSERGGRSEPVRGSDVPRSAPTPRPAPSPTPHVAPAPSAPRSSGPSSGGPSFSHPSAPTGGGAVHSSGSSAPHPPK